MVSAVAVLLPCCCRASTSVMTQSGARREVLASSSFSKFRVGFTFPRCRGERWLLSCVVCGGGCPDVLMADRTEDGRMVKTFCVDVFQVRMFWFMDRSSRSGRHQTFSASVLRLICRPHLRTVASVPQNYPEAHLFPQPANRYQRSKTGNQPTLTHIPLSQPAKPTTHLLREFQFSTETSIYGPVLQTALLLSLPSRLQRPECGRSHFTNNVRDTPGGLPHHHVVFFKWLWAHEQVWQEDHQE